MSHRLFTSNPGPGITEAFGKVTEIKGLNKVTLTGIVAMKGVVGSDPFSTSLSIDPYEHGKGILIIKRGVVSNRIYLKN
jgi:hypothetical protein